MISKAPRDKNSSLRNQFVFFILKNLCEKGGTRMQVTIADLTKDMQEKDAIDESNLYRKQFGNMEKALKSIENPYFYIDGSVVKMKSHEDVTALFKEGKLNSSSFELYSKTYEENQIKIIDVMRINKQNKCKVCNDVYKEVINKAGLCTNGEAHTPSYKFD